MGITQKIIPHYTYEDYILWEGNWELIDGFPIAMSPSPVPKHQRISAILITAFELALKKCTTCNVYNPVDYYVDDYTILQPDLMILCQKPTKKFIDFTPSLVAEILSPSTALRDRNTKYELYQNEGVPYYLIVDTDNKKMEIYQLTNGKYVLVPDKEDNRFVFYFEDGCVANVNLDEVWVE